MDTLLENTIKGNSLPLRVYKDSAYDSQEPEQS